MYNLLVSANPAAWDGAPFVMEVDRVCEYTNPEIADRYSKLDGSSIDALKGLPCIFAYEAYC